MPGTPLVNVNPSIVTWFALTSKPIGAPLMTVSGGASGVRTRPSLPAWTPVSVTGLLMLAPANAPGPTSIVSPPAGFASVTACWIVGSDVPGIDGQPTQTLMVAALAEAADPSTAMARMANKPNILGREKRMDSPSTS